MKNYAAAIFRLTSLLEKLGIRSALSMYIKTTRSDWVKPPGLDTSKRRPIGLAKNEPALKLLTLLSKLRVLSGVIDARPLTFSFTADAEL